MDFSLILSYILTYFIYYYTEIKPNEALWKDIGELLIYLIYFN